MHRLSMEQALWLWSDLEAAYYEKNGYGGDTAEIYLYRAMKYEPMVVHGNGSAMSQEAAREAYQAASEALYELFVQFEKTHEDARLLVEEKKLGKWMCTAGYQHRIHVQVKRKK